MVLAKQNLQYKLMVLLNNTHLAWTTGTVSTSLETLQDHAQCPLPAKIAGHSLGYNPGFVGLLLMSLTQPIDNRIPRRALPKCGGGFQIRLLGNVNHEKSLPKESRHDVMLNIPIAKQPKIFRAIRAHVDGLRLMTIFVDSLWWDKKPRYWRGRNSTGRGYMRVEVLWHQEVDQSVCKRGRRFACAYEDIFGKVEDGSSLLDTRVSADARCAFLKSLTKTPEW